MPETLMSLLWQWRGRICGSVALLAIPALCAAQAAVTDGTTQAKLQTTYVWQRKPAFPAAYSGTNSLSPEAERRSYTLSATAFLGTRTWQGGELYFNPEMIMGQSLSNLTGLGGLSNGENQKGGGPDPTFYLARLFVRHTWGYGGDRNKIESAPNQLAGQTDRRRLVLTAGKLSLTDIFDNNSFSHDPRTQFLNWSLMTHGAFDYAADQRGYSVGSALEFYYDDWAFRAGRFEQNITQNIGLFARTSWNDGGEEPTPSPKSNGRYPAASSSKATPGAAKMTLLALPMQKTASLRCTANTWPTAVLVFSSAMVILTISQKRYWRLTTVWA